MRIALTPGNPNTYRLYQAGDFIKEISDGDDYNHTTEIPDPLVPGNFNLPQLNYSFSDLAGFNQCNIQVTGLGTVHAVDNSAQWNTAINTIVGAPAVNNILNNPFNAHEDNLGNVIGQAEIIIT